MNATPVFRLVALLGLSLALCLPGCGRKSEPELPALPHQMHWPAVEGADSYLVRAWSGYRLLFAQSSSDTQLTLTENMRRVLADRDSVSLEVKALDASEAPVPGGHHRYERSQLRKVP